MAKWTHILWGMPKCVGVLGLKFKDRKELM